MKLMSVTLVIGIMEFFVSMMPLVTMNRLSVTMMTSIHHSSTFQAKRSNAPTATYQSNDCTNHRPSATPLTRRDSKYAPSTIPTVISAPGT